MTESTMLLRQAHPNFVDGDIITSQVFMPFPRDDGLLSVYNGDKINPAEAYNHYTKKLRYLSHSVWGVRKAEVDAELLPSRDDPQPGFPEHAVIDYTGFPEKKELRKKAKRLQVLALAHGCLYSS
jgi:hypothetical protein